jgi:hypothetical protein
MKEISMRPELRSAVHVIRAIATTTMALVLAGALSACARNDLKWIEDVRLPDGRVVTLDRYVEFKGPSQLGDPSTESLQRLSFKHPTTGEVVRWESAREQGLLKTIALWLDRERPVLLTRPAYGGDQIKLKCPNPPYLLYEYEQGSWRSKPLAQIGVDRLRSNMTTNSLEKRAELETNMRRLTADQTADSYTYRNGNVRVPYILDFKGMPEQTFRVHENCDRPNNYLLAK